MWLLALILPSLLTEVAALNNGLALTPPMGWMSWTTFKCETDCGKHPNACINEQLYQQMADRLVSDGYRDVGYNRIHVDDCWLAWTRDSNGKLQPNATRFPNGINGLTKYMHDRNLYFGIYEDVGKMTCAGYPGSEGNYEKDAQTFADWNCDYLKFDGCHYPAVNGHIGYPAMRKALNKTGKPIMYSCEWPFYLEVEASQVNYTDVSENCNLWRNFNDVADSWLSIHSIITFYHAHQDLFAKFHAPGQWNDPDMIVAGNPGITFDQAKTQFTVWSIWSAPLILSNDLRTLSDQYKQMIQNKDVIAIDQDPLAKMGKVVATVATDVLLYAKPVTPVSGNNTSYAIATVNTSKQFKHTINVNLQYFGLTNPKGYQVKDLWSGADLGVKLPTDPFQVQNIPTTGSMLFKLYNLGKSDMKVVESIQFFLYLCLCIYILVSLYWILIQHDIIDWQEARRRREEDQKRND